MIKMDDMIMLKLGTMKQVSHNPGIFRNLYSNRIFDCPHRGQSMWVSSDPAGALDKMVCIARITPLKDDLYSSKHLTRAPGIYHLSPGHLNFDA